MNTSRHKLITLITFLKLLNIQSNPKKAFHQLCVIKVYKISILRANRLMKRKTSTFSGTHLITQLSSVCDVIPNDPRRIKKGKQRANSNENNINFIFSEYWIFISLSSTLSSDAPSASPLMNLPSVEMTFLMFPSKDYLIKDNVLMISALLFEFVKRHIAISISTKTPRFHFMYRSDENALKSITKIIFHLNLVAVYKRWQKQHPKKERATTRGMCAGRRKLI